MNEVWKDIEGYEGIFQVPTLGRVKSLPRTVNNGNGGRVVLGCIMASRKTNSGYELLHLSAKGIRKAYTVHRLVALAFLPNPENKPQVNHIDADKGNNALSNLEWATRSENSRHSWAAGLMENTREKARVRMSEIGKKYSKENGDNLRKYYAAKSNIKG